MKHVDTIFRFMVPILLISSTCLTQWRWQNPRPTGNDFKAIHFVDSVTGIIAGTNGTLFQTTDGGIDWEQKFISPLCDFDNITGLGRDQVWMLSVGGGSYISGRRARIFFSSDGGITWEERFNAGNLPPAVSFEFWDIGFLDFVTGYSLGDSGRIMKTGDGGYTWDDDQTISDRTLNTIQFLNDTIGFISAGDLQVLSDDVFYQSRSQGEIFRTMDGGLSWDKIYTDTISITRVRFVNDLKGWAAGEVYWEDSSHSSFGRHYLLRTTDGGLQWTVLSRPYPVNDIFFLDETAGYHLAGDIIYSTTDGGDTWDPMFWENSPGSLNKVFFSDPLHGFTVGDDGRILQYSWTGTWSHYDKRTTADGNEAVHFLDTDTGLIATSHTIQRTTDAGESWTAVTIPNIYSMDCSDMRNCWAVGWAGKIYHSGDAGVMWSEQTSGVTSNLYVVGFVDSLTGWAAGENSTIVKTTDGGQNWYSLSPPSFYTLLDRMTIQDSQRLWVRSLSQESGYSSDGGASWIKVDSGITGLFFLNPDTGWGRDYDSLYRTTNGGIDWEPIGWRGIAYPQFVDLNNGWSTQSTNVFRMTDGGRSWYSELGTSVVYKIRSLHMIDSAHGWAVGWGGSVIRYGYNDRLTSIDHPESPVVPSAFSIDQNYPNPFNPSTNIRFTLPAGGWTSLKIVDILGREIATLVNNWMEPGIHTTTWDAVGYPSGVYFYRLVSHDYTETKKMLVLR